MPKGWIGKPTPRSLQLKNQGWLSEVNQNFIDERHNYGVLIRSIETEWGTIKHAAIRNRENTDISWSEKQRIKNEIFGEECTAVEVFPAESQLIDEANMYHLWILPDDMKLPFTLKQR